MDEPVWSSATFVKNRERLLESDAAVDFLDAVIRQARDTRPARERTFLH
jgi:hypothetical protein